MAKRTDESLRTNVIHLYKNHSTLEIASITGLHRTTIQRILKSNFIGLRRITPYNKYNFDFFSTFSRESCYWAGFIAADGCVSTAGNRFRT